MSAIDPAQVLTNVNALLEAHTRIAIEHLSLELNLEDGVLALAGTVDSIKAKRIAANTAARALPHGFHVRDRLRIRSRAAGTLELRDEVVRQFGGESVFRDHTLTIEAGGRRQTIHEGPPDAGRIDVRVDEGCVTLEGWVTSLSHRRFAEVLAWWIAACECVENFIEVVPPERDDDDEITDVVRLVLEKDPLVHASQLRIGTAGGIVELDGLVASSEERQLAVADAWYVPGVWDVVDRIEVREK